MLVELGGLIVDDASRLGGGTKFVEVAITRLDTRSPGMTVVVTVFVIVLLLVTVFVTVLGAYVIVLLLVTVFVTVLGTILMIVLLLVTLKRPC